MAIDSLQYTLVMYEEMNRMPAVPCRLAGLTIEMIDRRRTAMTRTRADLVGWRYHGMVAAREVRREKMIVHAWIVGKTIMKEYFSHNVCIECYK
jgi:hypothetical protein